MESVVDLNVVDSMRALEGENAIAARAPLSIYDSFVSEAKRDEIGVIPAPAGPTGPYTGV